MQNTAELFIEIVVLHQKLTTEFKTTVGPLLEVWLNCSMDRLTTATTAKKAVSKDR